MRSKFLAVSFLALLACDPQPPAEPASEPPGPAPEPAPKQVDKEKAGVETMCATYQKLLQEMADAEPLAVAEALGPKAQEAFAAAELSMDHGVIGAIGTASAEDKGPMFAHAVAKFDLGEACAGFPLLHEKRAIEIVCEVAKQVEAEQPDAGDDAVIAAVGEKMKASIEAEGLFQVGVIDAIASAAAEDKAPLFTAAVERYHLDEACAGFSLYQPAAPE